MGNIVLDDLLDDGNVTINGVDYKANPIVHYAISSYPVFYKFGCIGPDAYPDAIFGQVAIHPGTDTEESTDANVYSYEWFDHMLSQAVTAGDWETYLKAVAFTYGFMSHSAGDMFCHTFVNRYTGGVWSLPTNGFRHIVIESYINKKTGWKDTAVISETEFNNFLADTTFRDWIYNSLIDNWWAREHTSGPWEKFYDLFLGLRDQINNWLKEWDKDWHDRKWWAIPPVGWATKPYFEAWRDDINEGLKAWVDVSTRVAYYLFIQSDLDTVWTILKNWFLLHFLSMIGFPDIVGTIIKYVGDVTNWIRDLLENIPGLKELWDTVKGWGESIVNWIFEKAFGFTLEELKDMFEDPEFYLTSSTFFEDAPYGMGTKNAIDDELSFALHSGSFDPLGFDVTYNTIMMSKLLLLDGAGLNQLLKENGVHPFYAKEEAMNYEDLAYPGMCVMRGFMKSLDADHQWMLTAPNGKSYGKGTSLWEDKNAREWVFKKIFHTGSQVWVTPCQQAIHTGQTALIDVTVVNTANVRDTINIQVLTEGNGTFTNANDPSAPLLPPSVDLNPGESISYPIQYVYDGDEEVTGGRLNVTVTPSLAPARTRESPDILNNHEYGAIIVFKGQIKYLWLTIGDPKLVKYMPAPRYREWAPRPPFNPIVPVSTRIAQLWPRSPFEDITYVRKSTPFGIYGFSETDIASFSFRVGNYTSTDILSPPDWLSDWIGLTAEPAIYVWRTKDPFELNEQYLYGTSGSTQYKITDGSYKIWYRSTDIADNNRTDVEDIILDSTPPITTLTASDFEMLPSPWVQYYRNTAFTLNATDALSGVGATYYGITRWYPSGYGVAWGDYIAWYVYFPSIIPSTRYTEPFNLTLPSGAYRLWWSSLDNLGNKESSWFMAETSSFFIVDVTPPSSNLHIGEPSYNATAAKARAYITSETPLSISAIDGPNGTVPAGVGELLPIARGVQHSSYRIYSETYDSGWQIYTAPFTLEGLSDGRYEIDYNSTDNAGNVEPTETAEVILDNSPPTISIAAVNPVSINTPVTLLVAVDDSSTGRCDITTAEYSINDGNWMPMNALDGSFNETTEEVTATLGPFPTPDVLAITIRGKDGLGNTNQISTLLAVYDPAAGFVTGAGWINSLQGAYSADPTLTGKAKFAFVSRYQKGATIPTGQTEFQFHAGSLHFQSSSYQWLVVAGSRAQFKGSGTIKGTTGEYGFMLTAIDGQINGGGGIDKFRIKIWDKTTEIIIYDNQMNLADTGNPTTAIAAGNIVIHTK
jgi:hypothetical protein